jgi:hypothetical protein
MWLIARVVNAYYQSRIRSYESWLDQLRHEQSYKLEELKKKLNWYNTEKLIHRYESRLAAPVASTPHHLPQNASNASHSNARSGPNTPQPQQEQAPAAAGLTKPAPSTVHTTSHISRTSGSQSAAPVTSGPQPNPVTSTAAAADDAAPVTQSRPQPDAAPNQIQARPQQPARREAPHTVSGPAALPRTMPVPAHMLQSQAAPSRAVSPQPNAPQSWIDKLVDLLIGESPVNSFALICEKCKANNGLAPQDEMDLIEFACSKCQHLNSRLKTTAERRASSPTKSISAVNSESTPQRSHSSSSSSAVDRTAAAIDAAPAQPDTETKKDR